MKCPYQHVEGTCPECGERNCFEGTDDAMQYGYCPGPHLFKDIQCTICDWNGTSREVV